MSICKYCNGSGADAAKTAAARKRGDCDHRSHVRCWMCNGNGLEPPYPSRTRLTPEVH